MDAIQRWCLLSSITLACCALPACDSAADRKAREEAAINAGIAAVPANSADNLSNPDDPAVRAAAREALATAPADVPALAALPPPADTTSQLRSEIADSVAGFECRPDISAEDCAQAKASLAADMHGTLDDREHACALLQASITEAQARLAAGTTDLEADLGTLAEGIEKGIAHYKANCTG